MLGPKSSALSVILSGFLELRISIIRETQMVKMSSESLYLWKM